MSVSYASNNYVNPYGNSQLDQQIAETLGSVQGQMSLFGGTSSTTSSTNSLNSMTREEYLETRGCTDGNNDGKIGFFSAVGNIFKGAFDMVVNTVKDIVTDPKKLLLAVGTAALCAVFPPAGLILAGVGIVTGGAKVIGGISKAMNAKTDAEAKAAFQEIGAGGLTVGLSVAGAKASVKQMGAGSAIKARLTDASGKVKLTNVFKNNGKFRPVDGVTKFGKAMLKDAKTSTLGQKLSTFKNNLKSQADDIANTKINTKIDELAKNGAKQLDDSIMDDVASARKPYTEAVNKAAKDLANASDDAASAAAKSKLETAQKALDDFDNSVEYTDLNTLKNSGGVRASGGDYVDAVKSKLPTKSKITLENLDDIQGLSVSDKTYIRAALRQGKKIDPSKLSTDGLNAYKEVAGAGVFESAKVTGQNFFRNHGKDMGLATKQVLPYEMSKDDSSQEYLQQYYV